MNNKLFYNASINQIALIATIFSGVLLAVFAALVMIDRYGSFQKEIDTIRKNYLISQKELLINETERAMRYINHKYQKYGEVKDSKEIKEIIVDAIENMRNERGGTGYIFIYTYDGINIADPILKQNAGVNLIDFKDPNGKRVIYELIKVAKNGGGFVEYVWNKPVVNTLSPKLSYAVGFDPFEWMIGTGVYMDDIEDEITKREEINKKEVVEFLIKVTIVAILLFVIVTILSSYISRLIRDETDRFIDFFHKGATSYKQIDKSSLRFREFLTLVDDANLMIDTIRDRTEELKDLNQNLENKVIEKTKKIEEKKTKIEKLLEEQDKFVKNAIHEINTPISVILVNCDLEVMQNGKNRHLTNIESGAKIIHNIYNDLSYLIQKDRVEYTLESINLSEFLESRVDFFAEVANGAGVSIDSAIDQELSVNISSVELQRIIDNSLSNAIKYAFAKTTIDIELKLDNKEAVFGITNSAKTLSNIDKIFDRYYREDTVRGGFGLGLSIIKEICDKYHIKYSAISKDNEVRFEYRFERI